METEKKGKYDAILVVFSDLDLITEEKFMDYKRFAIRQILGAMKVLVIIQEGVKCKELKEMFEMHFEKCKARTSGKVVIFDKPLSYLYAVARGRLDGYFPEMDAEFCIICDIIKTPKINTWVVRFTNHFIIPRPISVVGFNSGMGKGMEWDEQESLGKLFKEMWTALKRILFFDIRPKKLLITEK